MYQTALSAHQTPMRAAPRIRADVETDRCNVLLLSDSFGLAYRVLRCFHAAGATVHVLGSRRSRGLRYSRFCRSFRYRVNDYRGDLRRLIDEINAAVIEHDIDLIACGEHFMMRAFVEMAPMLIARCFPMPSIKEFNLLNDKNQFTELCNELGVRCPRSQFVANISELRALLRAGKITPRS